MKIFVTIITLLISPLNVFANNQPECELAINNAATQLRKQASLTIISNGDNKVSPENIEVIIKNSQAIIKESRKILKLCQFNREMTEGVLDVIITNTNNIEQLTNTIEK